MAGGEGEPYPHVGVVTVFSAIAARRTTVRRDARYQDLAAGMSAELGAIFDAALAKLDRAATEASVPEDPLELPFIALAAFLHAQPAAV